MGRTITRIALLAVAATALAGCGFADSHASLPDFMRARAPDPPRPDPIPDVAQLVRDNLDSIFVPTSYPREVQVSEPRREPRGVQWSACVRAEVNSAMGKSAGAQTYRIFISGGTIFDRRRADADDNCSSEIFTPI